MRRLVWPLAGALLGGAVMFLGMLVNDRLFEASNDPSVLGFQAGRRILTGAGGAAAGLAIGVAVGWCRAAPNRGLTPPNRTKSGRT
jgi:hypothetical protein